MTPLCRLRCFLLLPLAVLALAGCATQDKGDSYTDRAIKACGAGNVAYVNVQEGRFGCKGGSFSRDH